MSETNPSSIVPLSAPSFAPSAYKNSRWNKLVEQGMVIPLEELPLDPLVFQHRTAQVLYQLAKEIYDMRQDIKKTKESVKKARKQKRVIDFVEEPEKPLATGNTFDLLSEDE